MCLRSCNAEYEERLFGQAKAIAQNTTNRQANTIVPNILLRLQAKQQKGGMFESMRHTSSWITKEAKGVKVYTSKNTIIERSFIEQRIASWQAHLQRISTFLLPGEGTWWQRTDSGYEFLDGEDTIISEGACPPLPHFRDTNLQDIQIQNELAWNTIITEKKMLPTPFIRLYDSNGDYCGRYVYTGDDVELDQQQSDSGEQMYHCSSADSPSTTTTNKISHNQASNDLTPCFQQCESTGQLPSACNFQVESTEGSSQEENESDMHITLESDNEVEVEKENSLKTKLATAISKALGPSCDCQADIRKLDDIRSKIKNGEASVRYVEKHTKLMSLLKAKLHQKQQHLRKLITNYEKRVYASQHKLPDKVTDDE